MYLESKLQFEEHFTINRLLSTTMTAMTGDNGGHIAVGEYFAIDRV